MINLEQTPRKYVSENNKTKYLKGSKLVPTCGSTDKQMITATFIITLDGKVLPPRIIYSCKSVKSPSSNDFS